MKEAHATITIYAAPETIWAILTDAPRYPEWDQGVERIEGRIALGEKITAYTKLSPGRAFPVKVTAFVPGQRMVWRGGLPLGLFTGERTFTLVPERDGGITLTVRETFTGPLLPLIGGSLPDMTAIFAQFVADLKSRAEGAAHS